MKFLIPVFIALHLVQADQPITKFDGVTVTSHTQYSGQEITDIRKTAKRRSLRGVVDINDIINCQENENTEPEKPDHSKMRAIAEKTFVFEYIYSPKK